MKTMNGRNEIRVAAMGLRSCISPLLLVLTLGACADGRFTEEGVYEPQVGKQQQRSIALGAGKLFFITANILEGNANGKKLMTHIGDGSMSYVPDFVAVQEMRILASQSHKKLKCNDFSLALQNKVQSSGHPSTKYACSCVGVAEGGACVIYRSDRFTKSKTYRADKGPKGDWNGGCNSKPQPSRVVLFTDKQDNRKVWISSSHMQRTIENRIGCIGSNFTDIKDYMANYGSPLKIMAGDFNLKTTEGGAWQNDLTPAYTNVNPQDAVGQNWTYKDGKQEDKIDYIWVNGATPGASGIYRYNDVAATNYSDHRALKVYIPSW